MTTNIPPSILPSLSTITLAALLAILTGLLASHILTRLKRPPYPPGPAPWWLIGNLYDIPTENIAQEYIKWGKRYNSDILHASALGNHIIVLNKRADVEELFERRGTIYSDRPPIPIASVLGWDYNVGLLKYDTSLRLHRKICKQDFGQAGVKKHYEPIIRDRVGHVLRGLATNPELLDDYCKIFGVSILLASMYGYSVQSLNDPVVTAATEAHAIGAALLLPGATLINVFPILKHIPSWLPVAGSTRRKAEEAREAEDDAYKTLIDNLRARIVKMWLLKSNFTPSFDVAISKDASVPEPSLIGRLMKAEANGDPVSAEEAQAYMNVARTLYAAAADTISSSSVTFVYLMAVNPEIQRKARIELDQVVGASWRLPNFSDRESLPYVEALYREVMRWKPPGPLAVPHYLKEDDFYKGYFIPKGSTILSDLDAICNDEEFYDDPRTFNPERFFNDEGGLLKSDSDIAFGIGRRTCPGVHLGSASTWLFIASILFCFEIKKVKDTEGNEIELRDDYDDVGIIRYKKNFQCSITPRSVAVSELIVGTAMTK